MPIIHRILAALCLGLCTSIAAAQDASDPKLLAEINRIRAIDNHMHGDAVGPARTERWKSVNPLGAPLYPEVVALRRDNPEWRLAWFALYGYNYADTELPHLQTLLNAKRDTLTKAGANWPSIVLDAAGVDIALVNTVRLGPGQFNGRFRWVPYADPLLWPFAGDKSAMTYTGGDLTSAMLLKEAGYSRPPPSLAEYRANIIVPTLARWKKNGAVAVKFLSAYTRGLDFEVVDESTATSLYLRAAAPGAGSLSPAERKMVEDFFFGAIAAAAGAQQLAVHVHTGIGEGPHFNNQRAEPKLLENAINSRPLRKTNFVLLHGGWPFHQVAQAMVDKPNTYVDFSAQTFYLGTHQLAEVLRDWLSWHPEKVLFGSDAYSDADSPLTDWEEKEFAMTGKARRALAIALTAMVNNSEISRERALEIARMVLRENAVKLYGLAGPSTP